MDLKGIISISGMGGLYKVVAQSKNGFIVESLTDKKRFPISSTQRISALEDISMYATDEDVPLKDILKRIHDKYKDKLSVDSKSDNKQLSEFFKSVLPNYDQERVYVSDIKKLVGWYDILNKSVSWEEPKEEAAVAEEEKGDDKVAAKLKKAKEPAQAAPKAEHKVKADVAKKGAAAKTRKKV